MLWTELGDGKRFYFISIDDYPGDIKYFLERNDVMIPLEVSRFPASNFAGLIGRLDDPLVLTHEGTSIGGRMLSLNPNPNSGTFSFKIERDRASDMILQLINMQGKIIWSDEQSIDTSYQNEINVNTAPGVYLLRAIFDDNKSETNTIIIK